MNQENKIIHIYDKMFKKILTLSSKSVIRLINGLFQTDYPPDSSIAYNWTEFEDDNLKKTLADTILTINGHSSYHLEAQICPDETLIIRMFDYGYHHACRYREISDGLYELNFPLPVVIYLYEGEPAQDMLHLKIGLPKQEYVEFTVPVLHYLNLSKEELEQKNLVILIPFLLLKMKRLLSRERTPENLESLKRLMFDDIIGSIKSNLEIGNITREDAVRLNQLCLILYRHLYSHYEELEEINMLTDESLILDFDIFEKKLEDTIAAYEHAKELAGQAEEEKARAEEEKAQAEEESKRAREESNHTREALKKLEDELRKRDAVIRKLQEELKQKG